MSDNEASESATRFRARQQQHAPVALPINGAFNRRSDRADAAVLGEQRVVAEPEQVEVECLVGLLLSVALDFDSDGLRHLAGREGRRAGSDNVTGRLLPPGCASGSRTRRSTGS